MSGAPAAPAFPKVGGWRVALGIAGVLLGSVISTLSGRITVFGLADIRGAVHAGFDEGAWITTAFTVAQMAIAFPAVWMGAVFGVRRVLLTGAAAYTAASFLLPFSHSLAGVLVWQVIGGLASGTFIPLTIGYVLRSFPARLVAYGIAVYGMNSELSQNVAASIEGYYIEHGGGWEWVFWQNSLLTPLMFLCLCFGIPREPVRRDLLQGADWCGLLFSSAGFSLLYAALDQGNRLDWFNSGLITGLMLAGALLILAFVLDESRAARPALRLNFLVAPNIALLSLLLALFRFVVLSTAYLVPQYLTTIQGYRSLEVGSVLLWIALPQFLLAPVSGWLLQRLDARLPLSLGFALIGCACFMAASLTSDWAAGDFLPSQIVQAVGQSLGLSAIVYFASRHVTPPDALSFGAVIQTARLFGGEIGNAVMQTYVRKSEQVHSALLGLHVQAGGGETAARLQHYAGAVSGAGSAEATGRATGLMAHAVATQANVLAYADGYALLSLTALACLGLILLLRAAPASPA